MSRGALRPVIGYLRHVAKPGDDANDRHLLDRFTTLDDQAAFATLVRRHSRLVLAACRKVLNDSADVEDAFQATFLVLTRKAHTIRWRDNVGGWLHGVAHRVAVHARAERQHRKLREESAGLQRPEAVLPSDLTWPEAVGVLHEELDRLPDKFRLPLLLCYLDGLSRDEAAQKLGWSVGSVKGNLERGRKRLHARLVRRGITLSAGLLGAVAAPAQAVVPLKLVDSVMSRANAPASAAPATVAALAQGVLRVMKLQQIKSVITYTILTGVLTLGVGVHTFAVFDDKPAKPEKDQPAPANVAKAGAPAPGMQVVKGRVLDPTGKPVAGARLYLPAALPRIPLPFFQKDAAPQLQATTGPDGRFEFSVVRAPAGMDFYRPLVAVADGFAADWAEPLKPDATGDLTFKLVPDDVPVRGQLVDLEGRPVPGVTVSVKSIETTTDEDVTRVLKQLPVYASQAFNQVNKRLMVPRAAGVPSEVKTDKDGRFEIRGIGRGRLAVVQIAGDATEHLTLRAYTKPDFDPKSVLPTDNRPRPGFANVEPRPKVYGPDFVHALRPTQVISGIVRDKLTGKPISGITINSFVQQGWWENAVYATTDAEGRYRVVGLPKTAKRQVTFFPVEGSPYLPAGFAVPDQEGLQPITVNAELTRGVVVTGRIIDKATGKPVAAGLRYMPLKGNTFYATTVGADRHHFGSQGFSTDANGRFRLVALPGPGLLFAQSNSRSESGGRYTIAKLDPADKPLAYLEQAESLGEAFIAADGHIESLLNQSGYKVIDAAAGTESVTVDMQFDPGRSISGTIVGPDGEPVAGCYVVGLMAAFDPRKPLSDTTFKAVALDPERPRTIAASSPDRKLAGAMKVSGAETAPPVLKLQPTGAVTGCLIDADGKPVAKAQVSVFYRDNLLNALRPGSGIFDRHMAETDADGRFRAEGVVAGQRFGVGFEVKGRILDTGKTVRELTITPGESKDLGDIKSKPFGE
jgi:RNA polymerase sigma factor (sigma-70 family)